MDNAPEKNAKGRKENLCKDYMNNCIGGGDPQCKMFKHKSKPFTCESKGFNPYKCTKPE